MSKFTAIPARLVMEPIYLVFLLTGAMLFLALSIVMLIYAKIFLGSLLIVAAAVLFLLLFLSNQSRHQIKVDDAASLILNHLKKKGLKNFELSNTCKIFSIPPNCVPDACLVVYEECFKHALKDFVITAKEQEALDVLRHNLNITKDLASEIESRLKNQRYKTELDERMADGVIIRLERDQLRNIRQMLGLSDTQALEQTKNRVIDGYRALFRRFASDGVLTKEELEEMNDFMVATGLTPEEASEVSRKDSIDLYRRTITMICQDGIVTDNEITKLNILENVLKLSQNDVKPLRAIVDRVRQLEDIRKGKLPTINTQDLHLKNPELCHWREKCTYVYKTTTQQKQFTGELVVTNDRMIFMSPERSFEFKIRRIANLELYSNAVELTCTSSRGQGTYFVNFPDMLEAILTALIRRVNFNLAENTDNAKNRHIPDQVKVAVWQRDAGACVRCRATDYLEYDHIIPFSRGGANSENNVQLLCRRCNLAKSANLV